MRVRMFVLVQFCCVINMFLFSADSVTDSFGRYTWKWKIYLYNFQCLHYFLLSVTLNIRFIGTSYNLIAANAGVNYTTLPWFYKQKQSCS